MLVTEVNLSTPDTILEAADALFGERGFAGVSARDVARRAGVPKASIFYHFGSMEALFEQVLGAYYEAHQEALERAFNSPGGSREKLHAVVDGYFDFVAANQSYARMAQIQVASGDPGGLVGRHLERLYRWTAALLSELAPATGPLAPRQFFLTFSGAVINTFTYAPALQRSWGMDPLSELGLAERRAHLHWLVEVIFDRLQEARPQDADQRGVD